MGQSSFDEARAGTASQTFQRSGRSSTERSPQKSLSGDSAKDPADKASRAQELMTKLHKEEKIRDAVGALLAELSYGQGQQHKHPANMIKQLNNLNSLKADSQHRKKVKAQFEAAEREVQSLTEQLRDLGFDEDDEISSGDEEGPAAPAGGNSLFIDDYTLTEDDGKLAFSNPLAGVLSSSAASSSVDLTSFIPHIREGDQHETSRSSSISTETAFRHVISILEALEPTSLDAKITVDTLSELVSAVPSMIGELKAHSPWPLASKSIAPFLFHKEPRIVDLGLRLLRLFTVDLDAFKTFRDSLFLDILMVYWLSQEDNERTRHLRLGTMQLIRTILYIPSGAGEIHQGIYRALVAIAEQSRDNLRHICVETLAELLVMDPKSVFEAGGGKVLLNAVNEPGEGDKEKAISEESNAYSLAVAMAFTDAADCPKIRRKYMRDGLDLSVLLTHFTDASLYGFVRPNRNHLHASAVVMQAILRSWVGLTCFDLELFVQCMTVPVAEVQDTLLSVLDNVLWLPPYSKEETQDGATSAMNAATLSRQFTAILLSQLQRWGLQERLVTLQTEGVTDHIRRRAQFIGSKIFQLSSKLIPQHAVVSRSMIIPEELSTKLAKASPFGLPTTSIALFGSESELQQQIALETKPNLERFIRFSVSMDDASFKRLLNMTHVLDTKLFRQWNWDALMELVQGPLRSPKRLEEVTRGSKFLKRLLSFYRPFKYRFSNLTITRDHLIYVEVGKQLMLSLLETPEGVRYLSQNKLFRQIAECLAQLDPMSGIVSNEPLFSVRRFRSTLCSAYSELIGVLSRSAVGQQILAQIRIFNMFYRVCDINREDVVRSVICALDYKMEGHPRLILAKALNATSKSTRLYATEFVGTQLTNEESFAWAVDLMVEKLYDSEMSVANAAAQALHNMCVGNSHVLDYLISRKPFLEHLNEAAEPLRILFMSRPTGFELLLNEVESKHLEQWAPGFNAAYVDKIEAYFESVNFTNVLQPTSKAESEGKLMPEPFKFPSYSRPLKKQQGAKVSPPAHFYGELALTEQGCRFLKSKGAIEDLRLIIQEAVGRLMEDWSSDEMKRVKGALWALGHVASRQRGAQLLDLNIAENVCTICKNAQVFSLKGTAFYSLGLFALSLSGAELLHQNGWDVVYDIYNQPTGVALPPASYYAAIDEVAEERKNKLQKIIFPPRLFDDFEKPEEIVSKKSKSRSASSHKSESDSISDPYSSRRRSHSIMVVDSRESRSTSLAKKSPQNPARTSTIRRVRTSSLGDNDRKFRQGQVPQPLVPSISASSLLLSPTSSTSSNRFDIEADPETSSRRSSYFDLIDTRRTNSAEIVLKSISQLGSYVLAPSASRTLVSVRSSNPEIFNSGEMLKEVYTILASGRYKQITRKFIFELFDVQTCLETLYKRSHNTA